MRPVWLSVSMIHMWYNCCRTLIAMHMWNKPRTCLCICRTLFKYSHHIFRFARLARLVRICSPDEARLSLVLCAVSH